jgi:tagatose 1,6-diphosphate aldolase
MAEAEAEKAGRLLQCTNEHGIIAAIALDARNSLKTALDEVAGGDHSSGQLSNFKSEVTSYLSNHSSALLLDVIYGLEAASKRAGGSGLILAYESATQKRGVPTLGGLSLFFVRK